MFLQNLSDTNADRYVESDLRPTDKPGPEVLESLLSPTKATAVLSAHAAPPPPAHWGPKVSIRPNSSFQKDAERQTQQREPGRHVSP